MLFPDFTQPALESNDGLLELIRARAADHPSTFSFWDLDRSNHKLKLAVNILEQTPAFDIEDWVDLATKAKNLQNYGEESAATQAALQEILMTGRAQRFQQAGSAEKESMIKPLKEDAVVDLAAQRCLPKKEAKVAIEIQTDILRFLQEACEELVGADAQDEDGDEEMPDAEAALEMADAVRALDTPWRPAVPDRDTKQADRQKYLDACREGLPFTSAADINWDFIEQVIHDRLSSVEYELLSMKENPKFFAEKMEECRQNAFGVIRQVKTLNPDWSDADQADHRAFFTNVKKNPKFKKDSDELHELFDMNKSAEELKMAVVRRLIAYEIFSVSFRYITELKKDWNKYMQIKSETGEFPASALRNISLLSNTLSDIFFCGAVLHVRAHIPCDPMLRNQYENFVTGPKRSEPIQLRENPTVSNIRYRKMACILWVFAEGRGLREPIRNRTLLMELAELLGPKEDWSSLNKGFMEDVRAAIDVQLELEKFQWRHAEHCRMSFTDLLDPVTAKMYRAHLKPLEGLVELRQSTIYRLNSWEYVIVKPPWHRLVEKGTAAEAPDYTECFADVKTERRREYNITAERNLRHFWVDLELMLEEFDAYPSEAKALLKGAKPLFTPKKEDVPLVTPPKNSKGSDNKKKGKGDDNQNTNNKGGASSSPMAQDTPVVTFSAGPGYVDRASRLVLEERREKEKTRGVPDPLREAVRAEPGQAPTDDKKIPVNKRAMAHLELIFGPMKTNQKVYWDDTVYMMTQIGFGYRQGLGSARTFDPGPTLQNKYGVTEPVSKHEPHPESYHYLWDVRQWARNPGYGLGKFKWTLDSFKLEGTEDDDDAAGNAEAAGSAEVEGDAEADGDAEAGDDAGAEATNEDMDGVE
ncbi:hypothetical protein PG989_014013 [Apiospora arundinis]